jgi:deoxyribodipyrimidine photo-lyase
VPELEDVPDEHIHKPHEMNQIEQENCEVKIGEDYPEPIINHDEERKKAVERFEEVRDE